MQKNQSLQLREQKLTELYDKISISPDFGEIKEFISMGNELDKIKEERISLSQQKNELLEFIKIENSKFVLLEKEMQTELLKTKKILAGIDFVKSIAKAGFTALVIQILLPVIKILVTGVLIIFGGEKIVHVIMDTVKMFLS